MKLMNPRWPTLFFALLLSLGTAARGEDAPAAPVAKALTAADITALIANLNADEFAAREKAGDALAGGGTAALPALRAAMEKSPPEAKLRLAAIIHRIKAKMVSISLTSDKPQYVLGEKITLTCLVKNAGTEPVIVLPPLDGSEFKERQPWYVMTVARMTGDKRQEIKATPGVKDDNYLNAFKEEDFITVAPGAEAAIKIPLILWWYGMDKNAGQYRIGITYSFKYDLNAEGDLQPHDAKVARLLEATVPGSWTSNELDIQINKPK